MRCSNRKLLIVFEGSAQRERTIVHRACVDKCQQRGKAERNSYN